LHAGGAAKPISVFTGEEPQLQFKENNGPTLSGIGSGLMRQEPMTLRAVDACDLVNTNNSIKDGIYLIRNPGKGCLWHPHTKPIQQIRCYEASTTMGQGYPIFQVSSLLS
jgi:hypothetical protein